MSGPLTQRPRNVVEVKLSTHLLRGDDVCRCDTHEGWTLAELSRRSGVPESTLQRWGRRLRREGALIPQPFVEVVAMEEPSRSDQVEVLLCSGRTLYLPARRPFPGLADLVTLLESC